MKKLKYPNLYNLNPENIFLVGGAVRDLLMGFNPKDKDYLVINTEPEELADLGFEQVGADFPVFLHPETGEEFALARKERKTGLGYNGFDVEVKGVSVEEDLMRRDLTINAMAINYKGDLIDPFGGYVNIKSKLLKHVGIHFKEDPVRILRTARFAARYNFSVHKETIDFMSEMIENGEFDNLTKERVWKEFEKVIHEPYLENFFSSLRDIGAIEKLGKFKTIYNKPSILKTITDYPSEDIKFSSIFMDFNAKELNDFKMPAINQKNILFFNKWLNEHFYLSLKPVKRIEFIKDTKAIHEPTEAIRKLNNLMDYKKVVSFGNDLSDEYKLENIEAFKEDVEKIQSINYAEILKKSKKSEIGKNILEEQLRVLDKSQNKLKP